MPVVQINRIAARIRELFDGQIDMTDWAGKDDSVIQDAFLSRALAAYAIHVTAGADPVSSVASVTDGGGDEGLDAIHWNDTDKMLYLVQSKWSKTGTQGVDRGDNQKFLSGCHNLLQGDLSAFNSKIQAKSAEIRAALNHAAGKFTLILANTTDKTLSSHAKRDLDDFLEDVNGTSIPIASYIYLDQSALHTSLLGASAPTPIELEIALHEWGKVTDPYEAFYGQVTLSDVLTWKNWGTALFASNLRNFAGLSDVFQSVSKTLLNEAQHFWYFNNGATILCKDISKSLLFGSNRQEGRFTCKGVSVVNGAQTIGTVWDVFKSGETLDPSARLHVRLISLKDCPEGFASEVTRAANTQKKMELSDFVSLDPNQHRLAREFALDRRHYVFRTGDPPPSEKTGCTFNDAAIALACALGDVRLAVQAKREISELWANIAKPPYKSIFPDGITSDEVWRAVSIYKVVEKALDGPHSTTIPKAETVAVHGSRFLLYRVFRNDDIKAFRDLKKSLDELEALVLCHVRILG